MAVLTLGEDGLISICADIFPSPCEQWPHDTHRRRAGGQGLPFQRGFARREAGSCQKLEMCCGPR